MKYPFNRVDLNLPPKKYYQLKKRIARKNYQFSQFYVFNIKKKKENTLHSSLLAVSFRIASDNYFTR